MWQFYEYTYVNEYSSTIEFIIEFIIELIDFIIEFTYVFNNSVIQTLVHIRIQKNCYKGHRIVVRVLLMNCSVIEIAVFTSESKCTSDSSLLGGTKTTIPLLSVLLRLNAIPLWVRSRFKLWFSRCTKLCRNAKLCKY